jgi:V/A-type H+-transporting ATPase subunit C
VGVIIVISRPFSTYVKFVYPNAKFEAMGNPYIDEKGLSNVINSKNLSDLKDSLNASKDYNISGETTFEVQKSLDDAFQQTVEMMRKDSSKKMSDFYDTYLEKIDIYLIKNELKNKIKGKEINEKSIDQALLPHTKAFLQRIIDVEKENLKNVLDTYDFSKELIHAISEEEVDLLLVDNEIDKYIINKFKRIKVPYKCNQGKQRFIRTLIDINNIKNVLRAKQLGYDKTSCMKLFLGEGQEIASWKFEEISDVESVSQVISSLEGTSYYEVLRDAIEEYNKGKSVQVLEITLDHLLLKLVKDISMQNYVTIGPTIRFLVSKEFEIRNLKIIAKGIGESLSIDIIRTFLIVEAGI